MSAQKISHVAQLLTGNELYDLAMLVRSIAKKLLRRSDVSIDLNYNVNEFVVKMDNTSRYGGGIGSNTYSFISLKIGDKRWLHMYCASTPPYGHLGVQVVLSGLKKEVQGQQGGAYWRGVGSEYAFWNMVTREYVRPSGIAGFIFKQDVPASYRQHYIEKGWIILRDANAFRVAMRLKDMN